MKVPEIVEGCNCRETSHIKEGGGKNPCEVKNWDWVRYYEALDKLEKTIIENCMSRKLFDEENIND